VKDNLGSLFWDLEPSGSPQWCAKMNDEVTFPLIDHTALSDKVYEVLKKKILERELRPGDKVQVDEVANQLGVSRTPVKDALNRLALEGLIDKVARRGTFVSTMSAQDVDELFDLRLLMESFAAEKVLEKDRADSFLAEMRKCMANIDRIAQGDDPDYDAYLAWNRDLHLSLIKLADNNRLLQMYESLNVPIQVARVHYLHNIESVTHTQQEHQAIYQAFQNRDLGQAKQAIAAHINSVRDAVLSSLKADKKRQQPSQMI
jgi:DNA-binding GntR family transcriptional regulator